MGTNYYARYSPCEKCGRCSAEKQIGKASGGWKFLFQAHDGLFCWFYWKKELQEKGVQIWDEYNERLSLEQLEEIIENKQKDPRNISHGSLGDYYQDVEGYDFCR